tara:strand:+ start:201 stop:422 length:222 start_codon:yes stop_codon:yes gene_type:complete
MKRYGYGDGTHEIWLCYKCGKFVGRAGGDQFFSFMAREHPNVIMTLIEQKILTPIANSNHGKKPNRRTKTFGR